MEVKPAEPAPSEGLEHLDPELLTQQEQQRQALLSQFGLEVERVAVWFEEACAREGFEPDEEMSVPWQTVMQFVKSTQCLAPKEMAPSGQPPKKRLSKIVRQFEQVKTGLIKKHQEQARTLALVQQWRVHGCKGPQPDLDVLRAAPDPSQLTLPQHLQKTEVGEFPSVKVQFPLFIKTSR